MSQFLSGGFALFAASTLVTVNPDRASNGAADSKTKTTKKNNR